MEQNNNFIRQKQSDGTDNPTYVDLLEEDKPLSGQKFACISFVSPENILKHKKHFYFEEFLKDFDQVLFFGDKKFQGGNDYKIYSSNRTTGVTVNAPADLTKKLAFYLNNG